MYWCKFVTDVILLQKKQLKSLLFIVLKYTMMSEVIKR